MNALSNQNFEFTVTDTAKETITVAVKAFFCVSFRRRHAIRVIKKMPQLFGVLGAYVSSHVPMSAVSGGHSMGGKSAINPINIKSLGELIYGLMEERKHFVHSNDTQELVMFGVNTMIHYTLECFGLPIEELSKIGEESFNLACRTILGDNFVDTTGEMALDNEGRPMPHNIDEIKRYIKSTGGEVNEETILDFIRQMSQGFGRPKIVDPKRYEPMEDAGHYANYYSSIFEDEDDGYPF